MYRDLDTVHTPATGKVVPGAWLRGVRENFQHFTHPYMWVATTTNSLAEFLVPPSATGTADTPVEFDLADADTHDPYRMIDTSDTSRWTIPQDGWWWVSCMAEFEAGNSGAFAVLSLTGPGDAQIFNAAGARVRRVDQAAVHGAAFAQIVAISQLLELSAGQSLYWLVGHDSAADLEVRALASCRLVSR